MALQGKLFIKYSWLPNVWSNYLEKIGTSCLDWVHWKCRPHTDNYKSTFMTLFMSELGLKYAVKTKYYCNGTLSWFKQICSNKVGWVMTHGGLSESTEHLNLVCIHITKGIHCQNLSTFKNYKLFDLKQCGVEGKILCVGDSNMTELQYVRM